MPTTTAKLPVCCARRQAKLTMDKANLARLAKLAAARDAKNQDITRLKLKMEECKATIALDEQAIVDHDAEHVI